VGGDWMSTSPTLERRLTDESLTTISDEPARPVREKVERLRIRGQYIGCHNVVTRPAKHAGTSTPCVPGRPAAPKTEIVRCCADAVAVRISAPRRTL